MPTAHSILSIVVDSDLRRRLRAEATRQGKSVSRLVREMVEERLRPPGRRRRGRPSALLAVSGLAHGELAGLDLDRELYGE